MFWTGTEVATGTPRTCERENSIPQELERDPTAQLEGKHGDACIYAGSEPIH